MIGAHTASFDPMTVMVALVLALYFLHYMFASITAHVTTLLPVLLSVGAAMPGLDMKQYTVMLLMTLGIMSILTPTRPGPRRCTTARATSPRANSGFWARSSARCSSPRC